MQLQTPMDKQNFQAGFLTIAFCEISLEQQASLLLPTIGLPFAREEGVRNTTIEMKNPNQTIITYTFLKKLIHFQSGYNNSNSTTAFVILEILTKLLQVAKNTKKVNFDAIKHDITILIEGRYFACNESSTPDPKDTNALQDQEFEYKNTGFCVKLECSYINGKLSPMDPQTAQKTYSLSNLETIKTLPAFPSPEAPYSLRE
jgi:hypothetical protein